MQGRTPYKFTAPLGMSLLLSANIDDVRAATDLSFAAGQVLGKPADAGGIDLRTGFDFDGVAADDSSERTRKAKSELSWFAHTLKF